MEFTSMEILKRMLRTEDKRYQDCEVIMDVLTRAACLKSVEGSFPEKVFWTHPPSKLNKTPKTHYFKKNLENFSKICQMTLF